MTAQEKQRTDMKQLRQQAQQPVSQAGTGVLARFFEKNKKSITAVLPQHVDTNRMMRIALSAVRSTPKLMECTTESLFGSLVQCSQLGLEPNTPLGHAYLIPFYNKAARRTDVNVVIGYRGLIDLARRSGEIISISAHAVHQNDKFTYEYGLNEDLKHIPADGDRGTITHFYAVAKLEGGGHAFEVMSRAEVEKIRDAGNNNPVWAQHFSEMGRKTVIRRLFKYLPVSIEVARAAELDAQHTMGEDQNMNDVLEGEFTTVATPDTYIDGPGEEEEPPEPTNANDAPEWPKLESVDGKSVWKDSQGNTFDPKQHALAADSNIPIVDQNGSFFKKLQKAASTANFDGME